MDADQPARTRLADAWPLFGLRLRTEHLVLPLPTDDDLLALMDLGRAGIHPSGEMPFGVAWSILPSSAFERGYLAYHWANRSSWSAGDRELGLAASLDGVLIGMQGMHARQFATMRTVHTGSWVGRAYQGHGHGKAMRAAMLSLAFGELGALLAETEAFLDNTASNAVSRSLGYAENGMGSLAPEGIARPTQRFLMTEAMWRSRPRPPVTIDGLEACRELFGA